MSKTMRNTMIIVALTVVIWGATTIGGPIAHDNSLAKYRADGYEVFLRGEDEEAIRYVEEEFLNGNTDILLYSDAEDLGVKEAVEDLNYFGSYYEESPFETEDFLRNDVNASYYCNVTQMPYEVYKYNIYYLWSDLQSDELKAVTGKAREIASKATGSDYEKVRTICNEVDEMIEYKKTDAFNLYSMINSGEGQCWDYAEMFCLACNEAGINSHIVRGQVKGNEDSYHRWTIVEVDGKWYHCDPCWADTLGFEEWGLVGDSTVREQRTIVEEYEGVLSACAVSQEGYNC